MSESERVALALRGVINVVVGTVVLYAVYVIVDKYQSRHPWLKIVDWVMITASKIAIVGLWAYVMVESPYSIRVSLPLLFPIFLELSPRRWREGYWNDFSLRAISVAACCFAISEILFGWWR